MYTSKSQGWRALVDSLGGFAVGCAKGPKFDTAAVNAKVQAARAALSERLGVVEDKLDTERTVAQKAPFHKRLDLLQQRSGIAAGLRQVRDASEHALNHAGVNAREQGRSSQAVCAQIEDTHAEFESRISKIEVALEDYRIENATDKDPEGSNT